MQVDAVDPALDTRPLLAGAQFSDAFSVAVDDTALDARQAAQKMLARGPRWIDALMRLRDSLVTPFGLKTSDPWTSYPPTPSEYFRSSAKPRPAWSRASTIATSISASSSTSRVPDTASSVTATTLVLTHNLLGRIYLAIVLPFHRLIVRSHAAASGGLSRAHPRIHGGVDACSARALFRSADVLDRVSHDLSVDLFFSFRSPYSYLALPKTLKLVADYDATVNLRPVYPLAVRVPGFFKRADPQFARYVVLDCSRVAKHDNIPFRFPRPDPIVQDMATLDVAEHQPYIHRLTRLGAAAQLKGRSLDFADAISRVFGTAPSRAGMRAIISPAPPGGRLRPGRDGCGDFGRS